MTAAGLAIGAALALALLGGELTRMLVGASALRRGAWLSALAWLLAGMFATLLVAQLADYLQ